MRIGPSEAGNWRGSMDFKHGELLSSTLRKAIKNKRIDAAVAFWGGDAFNLLGLENAKAGSRVICDAYSGACNPTAIKDLLDAGFEVYDRPGLHAKVYICGSTLIVGSANASANGLGEEDEAIDVGLEAALVTTERAAITDAKAWFEGHINAARKLGPENISTIEELWARRRNVRPNRKKVGARASLTLENAILHTGHAFKDRRIFALIYKAEETPDAAKEKYLQSPFGKDKSLTDEYTPFFWDAAELRARTDDLILSFEWDGKTVKIDDMCHVEGVIDNGYIVPFKPERRPLGFSYSTAQGERLARRVNALVKQRKLNVSGGLIPLSEFARILADAE